MVSDLITTQREETDPGLESRSVLLIDDDSNMRTFAGNVLRANKFAVHESSSVPGGEQFLEGHSPDAVLIDLTSSWPAAPKMIERMRSCPRLRSVPVVALASLRSRLSVSQVLRLGAHDYLTKPFEPDVLVAKLETHLGYRDALRRLERHNQVLARLAALDDLTELYNRRALNEALRAELAESTTTGEPLAVIFIDIDRFKLVNDRFGHSEGDETLRHVARLLQSGLRDGDIVGRWGGEEFCALLPKVDVDKAVAIAERLRKCVAANPMIMRSGQPHQVTVSVGIGWVSDCSAVDMDALLRAADDALYRSKGLGRNRVSITCP